MLTWRRRILEALRLAPPSPETVLHRALRKCGARLVKLPSGAVYIERKDGVRLKVEPGSPAQQAIRPVLPTDRAVRQAIRDCLE